MNKKNLKLVFIMAFTTSVFANDLSDKISYLSQNHAELPEATISSHSIATKYYNRYMHYFKEYPMLVIGGNESAVTKYGMNDIESLETFNNTEFDPKSTHTFNGSINVRGGIDEVIPRKYNFVIFERLPYCIYIDDRIDPQPICTKVGNNTLRTIINTKQLLDDNGVLVVLGYQIPVESLNMQLKNEGINLKIYPIDETILDPKKKTYQALPTESSGLSFYTIESVVTSTKKNSIAHGSRW